MKKIIDIEKGKLVVISQGEYSDYQVLGVFIAEERFNPDDLKDEYLKLCPEEKQPYKFEERKFLNFVISKKLLKEIEYCEFHLGNYGKIDEMSVENIELE